MKKKIAVLAYSGGLDSTISIDWIKENYGYEVITLTVDLGGGQFSKDLEKRAKKAGAMDCVILDVKKEFASDFILPSLKAGVIYENNYLLATSIGRPLMAKKLVETAYKYNAEAVAHGCTGKGNDQVRFDTAIITLSANNPLEIIAPAREASLTRDQEKEYAEKLGITLPGVEKRVYSIDRNLWGLAIEGEDLEDPWVEPPEDAYLITNSIDNAPEDPTYLEIGFKEGMPNKLNGKSLDFLEIIEKLNHIAGENGVGRVVHVENRLVGIKSREVYEAPAATVIHEAFQSLEKLVLNRDQSRMKNIVSTTYSDLVYDGRWFSGLRENLDAYCKSSCRYMTGEVRLKIFKSKCEVVGAKSPYSLYSYDLATYSNDDKFKHGSAVGFIDIYSLPSRIQRKQQVHDELTE
ncbi:MAG: argininosuccinate synthase [Dehalococcoidia bacterium]|nr:argininosuccinate synthase [Chloroflexota bacterium]|tara:strand:- start:436 stop:1653 length:1218 start_codon:yes stop_codon:yes gene_type:complete